MQWRNIKGQTEALKLDLNMVNVQQAKLTTPELSKSDELPALQMEVEQKVRSLSMHLNQVRSKAKFINQIQQPDFWQTANFDDIELQRQNFREVIHLRDKGRVVPPQKTTVYDIKEDAAEHQIDERKTNIRTVDYEIYRQEVEKTLEPLFDKNPVLQKIRAGLPVTQKELATLNSLVHTQNPNIDLDVLAEFYPESSASVDKLLRTIVGLDTQEIEKQFTQFVQTHHINLNALQQRFIGLLKSEICRKGEMQVADLYEQPFISLHQDGIDGLFKDEQAHLIANFVAGFTVTAGHQNKQALIKDDN